MNGNNKISFAFFGSSRFSVIALGELLRAGFVPTCIVTTRDKPKGRGLELTPNPLKEFASKEKMTIYDPAKLDDTFVEQMKRENCDLFIVASYGKIIPNKVIELPRLHVLNIHPSLLPRYRGASPLQSAMLDDTKETGVTIIKIDADMDHGPIVAQKEINIVEWPDYLEFEEIMAKEGGKLLASILPEWVSGKILAKEQDHSLATFTKKITKEDGLIDPNGDPYKNFLKIQAFAEWPRAYFFVDRGSQKIRVNVVRAHFADGKLTIDRVVPEGKKEMNYDDFLRGLH